MVFQNDKISLGQLQVLIILDIFGTGVILLPKRSAAFAGRDGWLCVIIAAVMAMTCAFLICRLIRIFPEKSFFDYSSGLLTKPIAYLLNLGLIMKILLGLVCELRFFGEISKMILLYNTPFFVIIAGLLVISAYAALKGIETRARIGQIIIWFIFIPLIFVLILVSSDVDFTNILPVGESAPAKIVEGGFYCVSAFSGLEFILLISPYLNKHEKAIKRSVAAVALAGVLMCIITLITISHFGANNITNQEWAVLEMMDAVDLPGTFIERQEALIMSLWILSSFAGVNAGLFFGGVVSRTIFKQGKQAYYIAAFVLISFAASVCIKDISLVYKIMDFNFTYLGAAYMFVIPLLLNLLARLRGGINMSGNKAVKWRLAACFFIMLFSTACWDSAELENRAFVTAMAIEKDSSGNYLTAMEIPYISNERSVVEGKDIKTNSAKSLSSAIYNIDTLTDKSLYLGQLKFAVLGEHLLSDEKMFHQVIDTLANDRDISRKMIILASEKDAINILEAENAADKLTGTYIATYYKKNNPSLVYRQDLDRLSRDFAENGFAIIPAVSYENEKIIFSGAAVCENYELKGWLNSDELNGFLWVYSQAKGMRLQWVAGDIFYAININKCKTRMDFYEENGQVYARLNMDIEAECEDMPLWENSTQRLAEEAKQAIKNQINAAYDALYNKIDVDGFNFLSSMEKKNSNLYKIYFENMGGDFRNIPVVLNLDITISSTGLPE